MTTTMQSVDTSKEKASRTTSSVWETMPFTRGLSSAVGTESITLKRTADSNKDPLRRRIRRTNYDFREVIPYLSCTLRRNLRKSALLIEPMGLISADEQSYFVI